MSLGRSVTAELGKISSRPDGAVGPRPRGAQPAAMRSAAVRSAAADVAAALVVVSVVPLALLQVPDAMVWAIPPRFAAPGAMTAAALTSVVALAMFARARTGAARLTSGTEV